MRHAHLTPGMLFKLLLLAISIISVFCNYWYREPPRRYDDNYHRNPINYYPRDYIRPVCIQQSCLGQPGQLALECSRFQNPNELREAMQSYAARGLDICTLRLRNNRLRFLAPGTFRNMKIRNLVITDNDMQSLSPSSVYYYDCYPIFDGLQNSLAGLYFSNNRGLREFDFSELTPLQYLKTIDVRGNTGMYLKNAAYALKYPLERLDLEDSYMGGMSVAHKYDNPALNQVVLRRLGLDRIHREDFPNPASNLKHISLRENQLSSLPPNLFVNMPVLKSVDLSNNRLHSVPEYIFKPVANTLRSLYLYDNPIRCDCSISWLLRNTSSYNSTNDEQNNSTNDQQNNGNNDQQDNSTNDKQNNSTYDQENNSTNDQQNNSTNDQQNISRRLTTYLVCQEPSSLCGRSLDSLHLEELCPDRSARTDCS